MEINNDLLVKMADVLLDFKDTIDQIKANNLQNEQSILDWMDNMNKLSVEF